MQYERNNDLEHLPAQSNGEKNGVKMNGHTDPELSGEKNGVKMNGHADPELGNEPEDDPWALIDPKDSGKKWHEMNGTERCHTVLLNVGKIILFLFFLYMFICSLDFLSNAFKLLGGKAAGQAFSSNRILSNPVANLMIGVLATVLVQSSSTSTSIVVTMVAGDLIQVQPAIYIVMGANIGTSVTNTIVALGQVVDRNEFRRAFGGATVHDMFNWLVVFVLFPVEWITASALNNCGMLCQLTNLMVNSMHLKQNKAAKQDILKVITSPFTKLIIQVDKNVIKKIAKGDTSPDLTLVKHKCTVGYKYVMQNLTKMVNGSAVIQEINGQNVTVMEEKSVKVAIKDKCVFMFEYIANYWSDAAVGGCLLILALVTLCFCLFFIVKLLHSLLKGRIAVIIKKTMNSDFPGPLKHLTGYLAILVGACLTIVVQSSSIFTSSMTPLVGVGVLKLERMYPLTLGANIGTTFTACLAALASDADKLALTLQVALCHLFFNIIGIIIYYPIPFMRIPIPLAKKLGNTTAKYRWFAIVYLVLMFFLVPAAVFGLSLAGWYVLLGVAGPIFLVMITIVLINVLQSKAPRCLPEILRNWNFLPRPLHSLQPYDRIFVWMGKHVCRCCKRDDKTNDAEMSGNTNPAYSTDEVSKEKVAYI